MSKKEKHTHLTFLKELAKEPLSVDNLRKAWLGAAPYLRIKGVETEFPEAEGAAEGAVHRLTLYESDSRALGEPAKYSFRSEHEGGVLIYIYPDGKAFSGEEKELLAEYAHDSFFYYERYRAANRIEKSTLTQYMTGLPNSGGYMRKVMPVVASGHLSDYTAFFFNIKGFGNISKRYGFDEGNEIIRRYAKAVEVFTEPEECLGHLGGDNFTALIKKERQNTFIAFLADIDVFAMVDDREEHFHLSATIGVWEIENEPKDVGEVISRPAVALGYAKNVIHQPVAYVSDQMLDTISRQKSVIENFQDALLNEEFLVFYQPKVDSRTKTLVGAEGLVRWKHSGEMVSPGIFIPPLEQDGEIVQLDFYVLRRACADIRRWIEMGLTPVTVSVNFSRRDLSFPNLAYEINRIIEAADIDKSLIQIEVTETTDQEEHGVLTDFINRLFELDIMTAIDDFGSGYSTLSTLREFQVHTLKIDRSFINTDDFSWKDEIILTEIIHMAKQLGIHVVTEGVERDDQLAFVNNAGCYVIQGFYYDRPLPVEEFEERLRDKQYK